MMEKGLTSSKDIWMIDVDPRIKSELPMFSIVSTGPDLSKRSNRVSRGLQSLSF